VVFGDGGSASGRVATVAGSQRGSLTEFGLLFINVVGEVGESLQWRSARSSMSDEVGARILLSCALAESVC